MKIQVSTGKYLLFVFEKWKQNSAPERQLFGLFLVILQSFSSVFSIKIWFYRKLFEQLVMNFWKYTKVSLSDLCWQKSFKFWSWKQKKIVLLFDIICFCPSFYILQYFFSGIFHFFVVCAQTRKICTALFFSFVWKFFPFLPRITCEFLEMRDDCASCFQSFQNL